MKTKKKAVVLGGGIAGLAMGYHLVRENDFDVTVLEGSDRVGGLCGSFQHNGFVLDYGAHKLYSTIPGNLDRITAFMGDRLIRLDKRNRIFLNGHLVQYPLQLGNLVKVMGPGMFFKLGFGYAASLLQNIFAPHPPRSYEEYMVRHFGRPAYELVFEPLADKVWGRPSELHPEMARTRFPSSSGAEIIFKLLGLKKETKETNADTFFYPRAGFGDFPQKLKDEIESHGGEVLTRSTITGFELRNGEVRSVGFQSNGQGSQRNCDYVISTIPLPALSRLAFADPNGVQHAADNLQFRHLVLVYVFVRKPKVLEDQWIFFPERRFLFSRIFEQKQMNPQLGPADQSAICCDFTCEETSASWKATDEELARQCVQGLIDGKFIQASDVTGFLVKRFKSFYPRYDLDFAEKMEKTSQDLKSIRNLLLTGRLGMYNYNNSDHCFDMAYFIGEKLRAGVDCGAIWDALSERVASYKIVD